MRREPSSVFVVGMLAVLALSAACAGGGSGARVDPRLAREQNVGGTSGTDAGADGAAADPWAGLATADLQRIVTEQATARLAQLAQGLDLSHLADLAANPSQAPELTGRAVERLLDLAVVELSADRAERALQIVRLVRARARNRNSAFVGNVVYSEARRRLAGADNAAQERAIADAFRELPLMRFNSSTVFYQLYQRAEQLQARLGLVRRAMVSMETAKDALFYSVVAPTVVANRERYLAAIATVRQEHQTRPARADYRFATVDLANARDAREVRVAVWDLGVNTELFRSQLFVNAGEQANGADDDGNGQIDDVSGLVSDANAANTALLFNPGQETIQRYAPYLRGVFDLRAGLASTPAAQQVLELVRSITDPTQARELDRRLDAVGEWSHGTHVAGILLAGVPQARMAVFRSAWAGEARLYEDRGPTDDELEAERRNMESIAAYIQRHGIRVVNASLGFSVEYLEEQLRHETARYRDDGEVRARARAVQARRREFWSSVFRACPNTLFVVAAGNSNQDIVEYEEIPGGIDLPNVLAVGAVDRFGDWAIFTNSNPERVRIFDHGVEVDSLIPNGERVPLSGTSMASPNVANLAAKLFSVDSQLTPARATQIIFETGDAIAAPFSGRIANEERAIARVRRERGRARPAAGSTQTPTTRAPATPATPAANTARP